MAAHPHGRPQRLLPSRRRAAPLLGHLRASDRPGYQFYLRGDRRGGRSVLARLCWYVLDIKSQ